nr:MAG TPA: hypothetical protein [Caudoviricetes sp.]
MYFIAQKRGQNSISVLFQGLEWCGMRCEGERR